MMKTIYLKPTAKILIIQLRRIGDVLLTTPVIRALRRKFPLARIDFLVEKPGSEILITNPYLNRLLIYDKRAQFTWISKIRAEKYEIILDFLGNPRAAWIVGLSGAKHRVGFKRAWRDLVYNVRVAPDPIPKYVPKFKLDLLKPLGISSEDSDADLDLSISPEAEAKIGSYLKSENVAQTDILVGISPTSRRPARRWRKEGYAQIADLLMKKYRAKVIFLWGLDEEAYIDDIISLMKEKPLKSPVLKINELVALTKQLKLFIGNDNGPMHIAQGLKIPTVVIFGPTQSANWSEPVERNIIVKSTIHCVECNLQECALMECMAKVEVSQVEEAVVRTGVL